MLPFDNISGDPEQQYFSDGITEDIITELSRFRNLHVAGAQFLVSLSGQASTCLRIGRELGVHYVVEGSVAGRASASASPRS